MTDIVCPHNTRHACVDCDRPIAIDVNNNMTCKFGPCAYLFDMNLKFHSATRVEQDVKAALKWLEKISFYIIKLNVIFEKFNIDKEKFLKILENIQIKIGKITGNTFGTMNNTGDINDNILGISDQLANIWQNIENIRQNLGGSSEDANNIFGVLANILDNMDSGDTGNISNQLDQIISSLETLEEYMKPVGYR